MILFLNAVKLFPAGVFLEAIKILHPYHKNQRWLSSICFDCNRELFLIIVVAVFSDESFYQHTTPSATKKKGWQWLKGSNNMFNNLQKYTPYSTRSYYKIIIIIDKG